MADRDARESGDVTRHPFLDPISGEQVVLVLGGGEMQPYDGKHGVEHRDCNRLADVSPEFDCFYCRDCGWNGRVSGAWFMEKYLAAVEPA